MPFGVDLGTTNSSIAWTDESGDVFSLRVRRGPVEPFDAIERSIVLDPEADDFVVGQAAVTEAARRRDREPKLVRSFKPRSRTPRTTTQSLSP
jgi:molecular chaperone DnaK (HSP70)